MSEDNSAAAKPGWDDLSDVERLRRIITGKMNKATMSIREDNLGSAIAIYQEIETDRDAEIHDPFQWASAIFAQVEYYANQGEDHTAMRKLNKVLRHDEPEYAEVQAEAEQLGGRLGLL